jgi:hypothetical protein
MSGRSNTLLFRFCRSLTDDDLIALRRAQEAARQ